MTGEEQRNEEQRQREIRQRREKLSLEMEREVKRVRDYIRTGKWTPLPADTTTLS